MITQLDTENADRDITSLITVLTDTPHATYPLLCQGLVFLGDGTKNLDGTGGNFSLVITVGGQTIEPSPQTVTFSTAVRAAVWTTVFPVPANKEVILRVLSPNAADSDVDVTAYLYDVGTDEVMVRALVNKMIITEANGGTEMFDNTDTTLGSVAAAFSSDGTYTTRKRMVK